MASENTTFGQDKKLSISRFQYSFFPPFRMPKKPTKNFEAQMIKSPLKIWSQNEQAQIVLKQREADQIKIDELE